MSLLPRSGLDVIRQQHHSLPICHRQCQTVPFLPSNLNRHWTASQVQFQVHVLPLLEAGILWILLTDATLLVQPLQQIVT